MDKYKIDNHKLSYHIPRLNQWLKDEMVYPIYMEASPAGACNHRCTYCGLDFMGYRPEYLKADVFKERLSELGQLGLKSIMYAGEGEPFLHKDMAQIIRHTKESGIDVGVTTNAVLFDKRTADAALGAVEWIKVSINGATKETYVKIHRSKPDDLDKVIENMVYAAQLKKKMGYKCALGFQLLLLPENHREAGALAKLAADIGMDYLVIKPYSQHPQSKTTLYKDIKYSDYDYLVEELAEFNASGFHVVFRSHAMNKWNQAKHNYKSCLAFPFWSYVDASGDIWGCSVFLGDERFFYGNIYQESFQQIWEGPRRRESLAWAQKELDISKCRVNCRMDEINNYLWELKNPPEHVNFI